MLLDGEAARRLPIARHFNAGLVLDMRCSPVGTAESTGAHDAARLSRSYGTRHHSRSHPVLKRQAIGGCPSGTELPRHTIPLNAKACLSGPRLSTSTTGKGTASAVPKRRNFDGALAPEGLVLVTAGPQRLKPSSLGSFAARVTSPS